MSLEQDNLADSKTTSPDDEGRIVTITVRRRKVPTRLDKFLRNRFPRMSRSVLQRLIKDGDITVNAMPTKASYVPAKGDQIRVFVPPPPPTRVIPEDIPVDVIYEDDYILAINKRTGIICHPAGPSQTGTLVNALAFYAQRLSHGEDPFRPGIVHRLDKNTTGVMLVAKTDEAHWRLALQFERRTIQKTYLAIVEGEMPLDGDIIDKPLINHPLIKDRYMPASKGGTNVALKEAVTRYEVLERFSGFTLVHLYPKTGRTHQLRVHMSSIGYPIMGDTLYGGHLCSPYEIGGSGSTDPLFDHQCLHARRITFGHPIKEVPMTIEAPIPSRTQAAIDLLRAHRSRKSQTTRGS